MGFGGEWSGAVLGSRTVTYCRTEGLVFWRWSILPSRITSCPFLSGLIEPFFLGFVRGVGCPNPSQFYPILPPRCGDVFGPEGKFSESPLFNFVSNERCSREILQDEGPGS